MASWNQRPGVQLKIFYIVCILHCSHQTQWWSNLFTQWPHVLQWPALSGLSSLQTSHQSSDSWLVASLPECCSLPIGALVSCDFSEAHPLSEVLQSLPEWFLRCRFASLSVTIVDSGRTLKKFWFGDACSTLTTPGPCFDLKKAIRVNTNKTVVTVNSVTLRSELT